MSPSFLTPFLSILRSWLGRGRAPDWAAQNFERDLFALLNALADAEDPAVGFAGAALEVEAIAARSGAIEAARGACLLILRGPGPMPDLDALESAGASEDERAAARLARQARRMMLDPAARLVVEESALGAVADSLNHLASTNAYQSLASAREASQIAHASTAPQVRGAARL